MEFGKTLLVGLILLSVFVLTGCNFLSQLNQGGTFECKNELITFNTTYEIKTTGLGGRTPCSPSGDYYYVVFNYNNLNYQTLIGSELHGGSCPPSKTGSSHVYEYYNGSWKRCKGKLQKDLLPDKKFRTDFGEILTISGLYSSKYNTCQFSLDELNFTVSEFDENIDNEIDALNYCQFLTGDSEMGFTSNLSKRNIKHRLEPVGDDCLEHYYVKFKTHNFCDAINSDSRYSDCTVNFTKSNDVGLNFCKKLKLNSDARGNCIIEFAKELDDLELCHEIENEYYKGECILHFAKKTNQLNLCHQINHNMSKGKCYYELAKINDDPEICYLIEHYNDFYKSKCLREFARAKMNVSLCYDIPLDGRGSSDDRGRCIIESAKELDDLELCHEIGDEYYNGRCILHFAKKNSQLSLCHQISHHGSRGECYYEFAKINNDPEICSLIEHYSDHFKSRCLGVFAHAKMNVSLCYDIPISDYRDWCIFELAKELDDLELCHEIRNENYKDGCILHVAKKTSQLSLCHQISHHESRGECYYEFAKINNDPEICSLIGHYSDYYKRKCLAENTGNSTSTK